MNVCGMSDCILNKILYSSSLLKATHDSITSSFEKPLKINKLGLLCDNFSQSYQMLMFLHVNNYINNLKANLKEI